MKHLWVISLFALLAFTTSCSLATEERNDATTISNKTVYLVRHAEKVLDVDDPSLTLAGFDRAEALADRLEAANVAHILSSDYRRTIQTAQPLADRLGLEVALYDPTKLDAVVMRVQRLDGNVLVVGHSNTTPPLAAQFGADPGEPIYEPTEYDRLYKLNWSADGRLTSEILRYGAPSPPPTEVR